MTSELRPQPVAWVTRGDLVESVHYGHIVVAAADGTILAATDDPATLELPTFDYTPQPDAGIAPNDPHAAAQRTLADARHAPFHDGYTYWRSSSKPMQALALVESGAADRFGLSTEQVAISAASHNGEPRHVAAAAGMLAAAGLNMDYLRCGVHEPYGAGLAALRATGLPPTPLHHNCSGKHSGFLLACVQNGWPLEGYYRPEHPLQQHLWRIVAEFADMQPDQLARGVDGCSIVTFGMPLSRMARSYAKLADPKAVASFSPERVAAIERITQAMRAAPFMVGGTDTTDTVLMEVAGGSLFTKAGAEGLQAIGIPPSDDISGALGKWRRGGIGIIIKFADGQSRAKNVVVASLLEQLGLLTPEQVATFRAQQVKVIPNVRGIPVGAFVPAFDLKLFV